MKPRITNEIFESAFMQVFDKRNRKEYKAELIPVQDALTEVINKYPWLPSMRYLNNRKLFNAHSVPGGFMLNNKFAVDLSFLTMNHENVVIKVQSYYLTPIGLDFLKILLDDLIWESDELMAQKGRVEANRNNN
jgi:hypothetical protein